MKISKNFSYEELVNSATALRLGIDNTPSEGEKERLTKLARLILQPIRDKWGAPLIVTSGYRSEALNKAVGGSKTSQHRLGEAADIKATDMGDNGKVYRMIEHMARKGEIVIGQCIWEYGNSRNPQWIHVSLPTSKHINEFFRIR